MVVAAVIAAGYCIAINTLAFALFGIDKRRAVAGEWRIRETTLIGTALAGGWLGAKAGQRRYRHKTRKQPFAKLLNLVGVLHLGLLTLLAVATMLLPVEVGVDWMVEAFERVAPLLDQETWLGNEAPTAGSMPTRFGPGSGDGM